MFVLLLTNFMFKMSQYFHVTFKINKETKRRNSISLHVLTCCFADIPAAPKVIELSDKFTRYMNGISYITNTRLYICCM